VKSDWRSRSGSIREKKLAGLRSSACSGKGANPCWVRLWG
jgi:hypothetical protein